MPSSLRLRSIRRLLAAAARSSADCAQPMVRIASTQNVLKVVWYRPNEWPNTLGGRRIETMEWINYLTRWPGHTQQLLPAQLSFFFSFAQNNWVFCFFLICFCFSFTVCLRIEKYFALLFHCGRSRERETEIEWVFFFLSTFAVFVLNDITEQQLNLCAFVDKQPQSPVHRVAGQLSPGHNRLPRGCCTKWANESRNSAKRERRELPAAWCFLQPPLIEREGEREWMGERVRNESLKAGKALQVVVLFVEF